MTAASTAAEFEVDAVVLTAAETSVTTVEAAVIAAQSRLAEEKAHQKLRKKLQRQKKRDNKAFKARSSNTKKVQCALETVDFRPALVLECRTSQVV